MISENQRAVYIKQKSFWLELELAIKDCGGVVGGIMCDVRPVGTCNRSSQTLTLLKTHKMADTFLKTREIFRVEIPTKDKPSRLQALIFMV